MFSWYVLLFFFQVVWIFWAFLLGQEITVFQIFLLKTVQPQMMETAQLTPAVMTLRLCACKSYSLCAGVLYRRSRKILKNNLCKYLVYFLVIKTVSSLFPANISFSRLLFNMPDSCHLPLEEHLHFRNLQRKSEAPRISKMNGWKHVQYSCFPTASKYHYNENPSLSILPFWYKYLPFTNSQELWTHIVRQ